MAVKLFNRIGLRRDLDLGDLLNPEVALNNVLGTMVDEGTFTVEDIEPIKNIYVTDITSSTFLTLVGITVEFTPIVIDEETGLPAVGNADNPVAYRPFVKIKNRLDTAYFTTGEPFFYGGDGPVATYYDANKIIRLPDSLVLGKVYQIGDVVLSNNNIYRVVLPNSSTSVQLSHISGSQDGFLYQRAYDAKEVYFNGQYDPITGEDRTESDNFWERGFFLYGDKIRDSYLSSYGGVKWNGYFKPTVSGSHRFFIRSTGNVQFKFQDPSVLSSSPAKYGQPNPSYVAGISGGTTNQQTWRATLYSNLTDTTRKFVELWFETALTLATDDLVYVESLQGQLVSKQYRISTLNPSGELSSVDRIWIEVTEDFNRKNVELNQLPTVNTTGNWDASTGNKSSIRYYPYERRALKTYLNSIYKNLELPSSAYTISNNTITFTGATADYYYMQFMINDYIYDYRQRGTETHGARRFIVTSLNDNTKTVTVAIDAGYTGVNTSSNNDQLARWDPPNLFVWDATFGELVDQTYNTGAINDIISGTTRTNNLHFVARFGKNGDDGIRTKYITINQFIPQYEEHAFELSFFMKDEDIPFDLDVENKGIIFYYADENSGYDPINYKHLYDPDYEFYQIGDFKTFLDNTIPLGGTSREQGISQRTFGGEQLLTAGDQYSTFYTTLPLQSIYEPPVRWNDVATFEGTGVTAGVRRVSISDVVNIEVGNFVVQNNAADFYEENPILPAGTRVVEVLNSANAISGDAIISRVPSSTNSSTALWFFNHRGFVTTAYVFAKGDEGTLALGANRIYCHPDFPVNTVVYPLNSGSDTSFAFYDTKSRTTLFNTVITASTAVGTSNNFTSNGVTVTYTKTSATTLEVTGEGFGYVLRYKAGDFSEVKKGMVFVSNRDSSTQTFYRRIEGIEDFNNDNAGYIYFNNPYTNLTSGNMFAAVYYDKGIDIVKPLESYCNGITCSQNNYQNETVTNEDGEQEVVTYPKTDYILPTVYESLQAWESGPEFSVTNTYTESGVGSVWFGTNWKWWFDRAADSSANRDYVATPGNVADYANAGRTFKDDIVHVQLTQDLINPANTDALVSGLESAGYPGTSALTGPNDFIPIGRVIGYLRLGPVNGVYDYKFVVKLFKNSVTWADTYTNDIGTVINKKIDWTKFSSSQFSIRKWANHDANRGTTLVRVSDVTSSLNLEAKLLAWTTSTSTTSTYYQYTGNTTAYSASFGLDAYFHNIESIPTLENTLDSRVITNGCWLREEIIDGVRKTIYFESFDQTQGPYSVYGKHYTGTNPSTGMAVTFTLTGGTEINNAVNLKEESISDIKVGTSLPQDQYRYLQFRNEVYQLVPTTPTVEGIIPYVRVIDRFTTQPNTTGYLQNSTNQLSVYTLANTTTNRELCCPPLDTSPPFDSSPIGLATTINEPDMAVAGGLNVRILSAKHPVANILELPSGVTTSQLDVDKKLRIEFSGQQYDLLIGDDVPQAVKDAN